MNTIAVVGIILVLVVGALAFLYVKRKKGMDQLFLQVYESSKQIPKQKKHSFLLMMFNENIRAAKKKTNPQGKLNNPKYVEMQIVRMSNILKDRSRATDKDMKNALLTFDAYIAWEKAHTSKDKKAA